MGEVYRARDTKLTRDVALKVLPPAFTADADRVARFEREARLLASLNHPHIGSIYGLEDAGNVPALVLELVEGDTLDDRVRRGSLPLSEALAVAQQIADALDAAHASGIIHRDLKPSNIKITRDGMVKVRRATGSDGRRSCRRRMLASYGSRISPALRSLQPFHQTAGRWRSPPARAGIDSSSCSSLLAGRRCKSRAIQPITSTLAGRPTRARSSISRRGQQENARGAFGRSPRLAAYHGASSTAWAAPTSAPHMGGLRSSGWRRMASSW
jgi:serine/threonine protein kinase